MKDWLHLFACAKDEKAPLDTDNEFVRRAYSCIERCNWTPGEMDEYVKAKLLREAELLQLKEGIEKGKIEGEKIGIEKGKIEGEKIGIEKGKRAGIEEGKRAGIEEIKREMAEKMIKEGIDPSIVSACTGFSEGQVLDMLPPPSYT